MWLSPWQRKQLAVQTLWRILWHRQSLWNEDTTGIALEQCFSQLRGPFFKVLQILQQIPGLLPPVLASRVERILKPQPSISEQRCLDLLPPWFSKHFASFQPLPVAVTSLGQVHKASLHWGQEVACKIQYPGMNKALDWDLGCLKVLCFLYQASGGGVQTAGLYQEVKESLYQELNYGQEGHWLQWFEAYFKDDPYICIPKYYPELSDETKLVMQWCPGKSFHDLCPDPDHFGAMIFQAWWRPFFSDGVLHADGHMENCLWGEDGQLYMMDFGLVKQFSAAFIQGFRCLCKGLISGDLREVRAAYEMLGLTHLTRDQEEVVHQWACFLFQPFLKPGKKILDVSVSQGLSLAGALHQRLRQSTRVTTGLILPQELLWIDRTVVALGSFLMRIQASLDWQEMLLTCLDQDLAQEQSCAESLQ